jgi:hypothetical protein
VWLVLGAAGGGSSLQAGGALGGGISGMMLGLRPSVAPRGTPGSVGRASGDERSTSEWMADNDDGDAASAGEAAAAGQHPQQAGPPMRHSLSMLGLQHMPPPTRKATGSFDRGPPSLPPGLGPPTAASVLKSLGQSGRSLGGGAGGEADAPLPQAFPHAESLPALRRRAYTAGLESAPRGSLSWRQQAPQPSMLGASPPHHDEMLDDGSQVSSSAGVVSEPAPLPLSSPSLFEIMSDVAFHHSGRAAAAAAANRDRAETHE